MRIQFIGQGVVAFQQQTGQALAASGNTITPMRATMLARFIHIFLSPLLVFGLVFFPEMGLAGAALGGIIANGCGMLVNARALFLGTSLLHLRWEDYRFDPAIVRQIVKIGGPAAINGMERTMAQLILVVLVSPFGDTALAAFTLTRRIEMFTNLGSQGFGMASGVIVGQSLGAGKPERARATVLWATGYVVTIKAIVVSFLFFFPQVVLGLFTDEADVLAVASKWVRIGVLAFFAMGVGQVAMQSYQTAGDTLFPALVTLIAFWAIELPLAYLLSQETGLGQYGVAWAMLIAMSSRLLFLVPYFFTGRWMRARVFATSSGPPPAAPAVTVAATAQSSEASAGS
jgi:putative MATE family efflux protein